MPIGKRDPTNAYVRLRTSEIGEKHLKLEASTNQQSCVFAKKSNHPTSGTNPTEDSKTYSSFLIWKVSFGTV